MTRYRVSYTFTTQITGDEHEIRKAIRDLTFKEGFSLLDVNQWKVAITSTSGEFTLSATRTVSREYTQASCEREAARIFLYDMDLPPKIDFAKVRVEALEPVLAEVAA